jgi:SAM-dependent methyltransferase
MGRFANWLRYNFWYFGQPPWDTGRTPPELLEFIHQNPPGYALDIGCGTGTNLVSLAEAGWTVTGVDFAIRAVAAARQKLRKAGLAGEVRAGDAAQLEVVQRPDGAQYNLVLDIGCYHGLPAASRAAYCAHLPLILAARGVFLIYAHWKPADAPDGSVGISQRDFNMFTSALALEHRQDSLDRWGRSTGWMRFRYLRSLPEMGDE